MIITRTKKILLTSLIASLVAIAAAFIFIEKLLLFDNYKDQIVAAVQAEIKRTVRYKKGDFALRPGPAFTFDEVEILEKDGVTRFITTRQLTFKIAVLPLLEKKILVRELVLDHPTIQITRNSDGSFNFDDLLQQKKEESPLQLSGLQIHKGTVSFIDGQIVEGGMTTSFEALDFFVNRLTRGKNSTFKVSAKVGGKGKKGTITVAGTAKLPPADKPLTESTVNAHVAAKHLDAGHYWPYYQKFVPFKKTTGDVTVDSDFKGRLGAFTSRGDVRIAGLTFDYPQIFHAVLTPRQVNFKYDMELTSRDLAVKSLDLFVDGLKVKGSCYLRDLHSGDIRITAHATTSQFRLQEFHQYIPYGVIVKDPAEFIEQHIKGGIYRLDEGTLDGRVSQIVHMEKGENYNVLFIKGRVEQGLLTFGPNVPTFNSIRGELEMRGKDFLLNRMSGNFGTSPFTLDGKISDYPLDKPSGYPFTMVMNPRQDEAAWLFDPQKTGKLLLTGPSTLHLTGDGYTSGYNLSGDWDLSKAAFSYPDIISKPAGRANTVAFKGSISKQEAKLSSLSLAMAPLHLSASAEYRFTGKQRLSCEIRTNQFAAGEIAPLIPRAAKFHPSGKMQGTISGTSHPDDWKRLRWAGTVSFNDASLRPSDTIGLLHNMTGTVHFNDDSLETSALNVKLGNSVIMGRGTLTGFNHPSFTVDFSSPLLQLADIGLRAPTRDVRISQVTGSLALKDNNLYVRSLSGHVNRSVLSVKGTVKDMNNPQADLAITSSHLDLDDILGLAELERTTKRPGSTSRATLRAAVTANSLSARDYLLEKVRASLSYENNILYLQPFESTVYGGRLTGKGRFDFSAPAMPRHQITYAADGISMELLTRAAGFKRQDITGTLSFSGDLTAKGATSVDLRRTALGSARFRLDEGSIRKFPILSKIFSILNVSQLFKGRLPDMVSGGMPFNKITANLGVQDGNLSTQDLYVDSNAINISAVGKLDMIRDELDVTIGVQPLQTVDKLVSHLPIVGWILTGKDKTLITTYFEAKGKVDDPVVKAIPVKAMTKGVFNIFKRLFQLPAKLFTDTGEVIIGK